MFCGVCKKEFPDPTSPSRIGRTKYCSKVCANLGRARSTAQKRGDSMRHRGEGKSYTKLYGKHEHRVVMENKLGRKLSSDEIVHHIDGNKKNNQVDNLELTNRSLHAIHHSTKYNPVCSVERCRKKHYLKSFCMKHYYQIKRHGKIYEQVNYDERVASRGQKH
jgi:hypothetical protein